MAEHFDSNETQNSEAPTYAVVSPISPVAVAQIPPTDPTYDLSGKTVCELWDHVFRGDQMFAIIREELAKRFADVRFVSYEVFGNTHDQESRLQEELPRLFREHGCDVVISGVGC
jgi:hypothetical protein